MASQLFYTYTSNTDTTNGSYLAQSTSAIVNKDTYAYSLVFDVNRRTIWSQNKEYGGVTKLSSKDYPGATSEIRSGIPVQTYNGQLSYFYVNGNGELSIYNSVKITSFDLYDNTLTNKLTNQLIEPGTITGADKLGRFYATLSGTDAQNNALQHITLTSNVAVGGSGNNYPSTSGTAYTVTDMQNNEIHYNNNDSCQYDGASGGKLEMTLTVKDRLGNIDQKTITVAEFMYVIYYGTRATMDVVAVNNIAANPSSEGFSSKVFGNIGSIDEMKTIEGNQYFWVIIPKDSNNPDRQYTCRMFQGGGEAEWQQGYGPAEIGNYFVYRSPKKNIGGAQYYVKIN